MDIMARKFKTESIALNGAQAKRVSFGHWSGACVFLFVWLTFWTFGVVMLIRKLVTEFSWGDLLFATPFVAAEFAVAGIILFMIFGKTVITFTPYGGTVFSGWGRFGRTKEFFFPPKCEIVKEEYEVRGSKGGVYLYERLAVRTSMDIEGPREIYSSQDFALVNALYDMALEVSGAGGRALVADSAAETEDADALERQDRELLAGRPPGHLAVTRDMEGKIHVVCRRVHWFAALANVAGAAVFAYVFLWRIKDAPAPVIAGICLAMIPPLGLAIFSLFGKRTMTLDHGQGETFTGVCGIGFRRRFQYGGPFDVSRSDSNTYINGRRMQKITISRPGGKAVEICTGWPNNVKAYLAALLRHTGDFVPPFDRC